ncbi:MAG TPA: alpha-1,2-fucosyltransferase [Chitinophagales bacterium]|nr:alpha-1,2-fucosyltransferase [Chitinophagales bacterium]MCB9075033.1 alpha-1,2-fucosyltransferase [Chitinophagales bacterium]HMU99117.1 alpha-1,2-fucosyltransferase [Chitinophagales bacterium]HMV03605.1 alpha-1,2-fucosyltransferase [Chitinophagales bacterium]HMW94670.1 alpha-1,2-fucosyltransferase [Chitinophagales bacterium]
MIQVQLSGGLGNQMFQYAFGKHLAINTQSELVLDLAYIQSKLPFKKFSTPMQYELDIFNLNVDCNSLYFSNGITYPLAKLEYYLKTKRNTNKNNTLIESGMQFNADYLEKDEPLFIQGNFQSELYFKDIEADIREDFEFIHPLKEQNQQILNQIKSSNSVSIHIRRGDYLSIKNNASKFRALELDYYKNAMSILENKMENITYFVFSDDINWVKENLKTHAKTIFINHNKGKSSYIDMQLMSNCQHNIIANSTFSWWAAWLNANKNKIVVAPKTWFLIDELNQNDIVPISWISL